MLNSVIIFSLLLFGFWFLVCSMRLDTHSIWLLMKDSYDRAKTVGFRCVEDVPGESAKGPYHYR
jgi:hypothetical protein